MPPHAGNDYYSSLGIKVPKSRSDHLDVSGDTWLASKAEFDGAEGLWRVHDDIYDFTDFVNRHPGGSMWLKLTKGTDITEAFEAHHISLGPESLLKKFHVRPAATPRNCPFTFDDNGFYRQLKKEIRNALKDVPQSAANRSKNIADFLFLAYITTAILAAKYLSYYIGTASGILLGMLGVAAHNFFHQRDSFRMFYFDLTFLSSREWRISHALSHHLYTNTIIDLELQLFEPLMLFLPQKKSFITKYVSWFYSSLFYFGAFGSVFIRRCIALVQGKMNLVGKRFIIPFVPPVLMYLFADQKLSDVLLLYAWIICMSSMYFTFVGVNAAHQRPDVFHDGDTPRGKKIDWGISQLDAVMDRHDITGSHFLVLTNFGDHGLHHMFPTLDHGKLEYLYPTFERVCKKFGVELRMTSQLDMVKNTFRQLANETPNPFPPGYKKH